MVHLCSSLPNLPFVIISGPHSQSKNLLLVLRSLANVFSQDAGVQLMDSIRSKVM